VVRIPRLSSLLFCFPLVAVLVGGATTPATASSVDDPVLHAISATFDESTKTTRYEVRLDNAIAFPETDWTWHFTADPTDPDCNQFNVTARQLSVSRATFAHGEENGCHHTSPDHNVDIEVVAKVGGIYTCNARIHGTTTHAGPEPELCFKNPTPPPSPPPLAPSPPTIGNSDKVLWEGVATANFASGSAMALAAVSFLIIPVPDPFTKGAAGVSLVGAVIALGVGLYALHKANDPPYPGYKKLARPAFPRPAPVRAGGGVTRAEASAANALLGNGARIVGYDRAFLTSLERAQGAYRAKDSTWDRKQSNAAAGFARAEAKLLDARPALERSLQRAVTATLQSRRLSVADARAGLARFSKAGLPTSATTLLRSFKVTTAEIASIRARIAKVAPSTAAGPIAPKLAPHTLAKADRTSARLLRRLATHLAKRY